MDERSQVLRIAHVLDAVGQSQFKNINLSDLSSHTAGGRMKPSFEESMFLSCDWTTASRTRAIQRAEAPLKRDFTSVLHFKVEAK